MPLGSLSGESAAPSAAGVRAALAQVLDLLALSDAALVVRDGQSGEVLFDQAARSAASASTTKPFAAAAVGQVFAPDETLKTQVRQGSTADEIVLVPGGDTLIAPGAGDRDAVAGRAGLADLANQVVKALEDSGIDEVTLSLDASHAPGPTHALTWGADFQRLGIVGPVTMLGLSTERARENDPAPDDPVASTLDAFAALLEERGISVVRTATGTPTPSQRVLGSVESAPVRDQLALALTDSDNTLTEVLARQACFDGAATDFADVGAWIVGQVAELGIDTQGVALSDASGLSRENRVTADLLTDVLVLGYDGQHLACALRWRACPSPA